MLPYDARHRDLVHNLVFRLPSFCTAEFFLFQEGAQSNGFENLGLFAAGVVAANMAGVATPTLNGLSIGFVASRVVYNYVYIFNDTAVLAKARSWVYMVGVGICWTLYVLAGNGVREGGGLRGVL